MAREFGPDDERGDLPEEEVAEEMQTAMAKASKRSRGEGSARAASAEPAQKHPQVQGVSLADTYGESSK